MSGIPVWVALQGLIRGANVENYFCISKRGLVFSFPDAAGEGKKMFCRWSFLCYLCGVAEAGNGTAVMLRVEISIAKIYIRMEELKDRMMKLWKDTFGDPYEYIRMVFDTYFIEENVETVEDEKGRLISSLLGVPYRFFDCGVETLCGSHDGYLKGMYLCGLATVPDMRGKGLMKKLMRRFEERAAGNDYDFSFLIPADERLRNYYSRMGYVSLPGKFEFSIGFEGEVGSSGNNKGRWIYKHRDVSADIENIDGKCCVVFNEVETLFVYELKISESEFEELIECENGVNVEENILRTLWECHRFMVSEEASRPGLSIMHSWRDFIADVRDVSIAGGKVLVLQAADFKPFALMFCYNSREAESIDIRFSAARTEDCAALLLFYLKLCCFPDVERATLAVPADFCGGAFSPELVSALSDASLEDGNGETISLQVDPYPSPVEYGMMKWLKSPKTPIIPNEGRGEVAIRNSQRVDTSDDSFGLLSQNPKQFTNDVLYSVCKQNEKCSDPFVKSEFGALRDPENCKRNSNDDVKTEEALCKGKNRPEYSRNVEDSPEFVFGESSTANQKEPQGYPRCLNISLMLD